jgi:hypothetical protein
MLCFEIKSIEKKKLSAYDKHVIIGILSARMGEQCQLKLQIMIS